VLYGRITLDVSFQDVRVSTASMDSIIGVAFRVAVLVEKSFHPMQVESFEVQTAQRYVENLIIDFAADALHIDNTPATKAAILAPDVLRGVQFVFEFSEGCEGDINVMSFEWKSKAISEPYHQQYTDWLTRNVFPN
jgi:hypothetical protein